MHMEVNGDESELASSCLRLNRQAFPGDPKLQRQACWALLTLAANDQISKMIASEGGVGAIIAAMLNNVE